MKMKRPNSEKMQGARDEVRSLAAGMLQAGAEAVLAHSGRLMTEQRIS